MKEFAAKAPFHSTMFVHFRKRFPADVLARVNDAVVNKVIKSTKKDDDYENGLICSGSSKYQQLLCKFFYAVCTPT